MMVMLIAASAANGDVTINSVNFPDEVFRAYVSKNIDKDANGFLSDDEISAVSEINISGESLGSATEVVKDLTGMECFSSLEKLDCSKNSISKLDVSSFKNLTSLSCYDNFEITELDVSNNHALEELSCGGNKLTMLDVRQNPSLIFLACKFNEITELDVSDNLKLETLMCGNNKLNTLDVSKNIALTWLDCSYDELSDLNVSSNTALTSLDCGGNALSKLDVSQNTSLVGLCCQSCGLNELDVSNNIELKTLDFGNNNLMAIDLSLNTKLEILHAPANKLIALDLKANTRLKEKYADVNTRDISLSEDGTFDLSTLSGEFDVTKMAIDNQTTAGQVSGSVEGNILTVSEGAVRVDYLYDNFLQVSLRVTGRYEFDVNGDCFLNMKDVLLMRKILIGMAQQEINGDVNHDGSINMKDLLCVRRTLAGM